MKRISVPLLLLGMLITPCTLGIAGMVATPALMALFGEPEAPHYEGRGLHPTELVLPPDRATVVQGAAALLAISTFFLLLALVGIDLVWRGTTPEARATKLGSGRVGVLRARLYGSVGLLVGLLATGAGLGGLFTGHPTVIAYGVLGALPVFVGSVALLRMKAGPSA